MPFVGRLKSASVILVRRERENEREKYMQAAFYRKKAKSSVKEIIIGLKKDINRFHSRFRKSESSIKCVPFPEPGNEGRIDEIATKLGKEDGRKEYSFPPSSFLCQKLFMKSVLSD
jgi:hypothetical protein